MVTCTIKSIVIDMNRKLHIQGFKSSLLAVAFVLADVFVTPTTFAAFVPVTEPVLSQKVLSPGNDEAILHVLTTMSNRDIEKLTGKRLTLKEKAGLFMLRRKALKIEGQKSKIWPIGKTNALPCT